MSQCPAVTSMKADISPTDIVETHSEDVYAFELIGKQCARMLIKEALNIDKSRQKLNKDGLILNEFGFSNFIKSVSGDIIGKLIHKLYGLSEHEVLRGTVGMIVHYNMNGDIQHPVHVDDSDYTVNLCLGQTFTGGELVFSKENESDVIVGHRPCYAIVHPGYRVHSTTSLTSGSRFNFILWLKSYNLSLKFTLFEEMPYEIKLQVVDFLDAYCLCQLGSTSKYYRRVCMKNAFWKPLWFKNFFVQSMQVPLPITNMLYTRVPSQEISVTDFLWKNQYKLSNWKNQFKLSNPPMTKMAVVRKAPNQHVTASDFTTYSVENMKNFITYK
eukprot:CAMPEP_0168533530 /NCGR_PEP_ID=MMETSP0405-20121227/17160_1 /TAXON_ID=498012 /ORGANISM="Trichosphaerium sp, Strain Am-I-7 wt" /LENGTH=327 /DNA_ID=CAMNT_0008559665 /DNA_START=140 /DNA_END=1123 /DNA_ORIENTATION=+